MGDKPKQPDISKLPDFLQVSIQKGIVDERTAHLVELHRRTRGLGDYESESTLMSNPPDPDLTFDNYVVCKGNSFAVELARTVVSQPPTKLPYNPLYLYGDIGLGKTHLLSAIANAAVSRAVLLINTADLEAELERAERLRARVELREWMVSADILMVDDIQLCEGREDLQRDIFSILNYMQRAHRWVVISSDVPPTRLAGIESRLISRLGGGVIVSLQMGDREERRHLIDHFLDRREVPRDVVDYLADHITDNVRRLKAAVSQLLALTDQTQKPVTLDMAETIVTAPGSPVWSEGPEEEAPENASPELQSSAVDDSKAGRFKEMLLAARSEEEQIEALQMALTVRIQQLRKAEGDAESIQRLEHARELLGNGRVEEAIQCINT